MLAAIGATALLAAGVLAGCGDEDEPSEPVPPTLTATDAGASGDEILTADLYEVLSSRWVQISPAKQLETVERFIEENSEDCLDVEPEALANLARAQIGVEYDRTTPIGDVLLEGCAIVRDGL